MTLTGAQLVTNRVSFFLTTTFRRGRKRVGHELVT